MRAAVLLALLTTSCASVQINSNSGSSSAGLQVQADGALAAVILAGMVVSAAVQGDGVGASPPPMDPNRSVSEQDCTKPVDPSANLRCK